MKKLGERHPDKLLDLLTERLSFERSSVKLYDTAIAKIERSADPGITAVVPQMRQQRRQEKEHEEWLEDRIRELGSDAHTETELSELIERESRGVRDVVADDAEVPHLFHALLTAELVDDSGWKLLVHLADEADDADARRELLSRAREEEQHLIFIRSVVAAFARKQVLGRSAYIPRSL
jgi:bacterioferritin (cytochrome b1)